MKSSRLTSLLLALIATAAVAAFGEGQNTSTTATVLPVSPERQVAIRVLLPRQYVPAPAGDPFATQPPPPHGQPVPPEHQNAVSPALTFSTVPDWRVLGKQLADGDGWTVFLARGEETCVVRVGDTLDDRYRVLAIVPPTLTLQHLKTKTKHRLDIGDARE